MSRRRSRRAERSGHKPYVDGLLALVVGLLLLVGMTQAGAATLQVNGYVPQVIPCGPMDLPGQTQYACPGPEVMGASAMTSFDIVPAPSVLSAEPGDATITVWWTAPEGVDVVSYTLRVREGIDGTVTFHSTAAEPDPTATTHTVAGLAPGDFYVAVSAVTVDGESDPSDWFGPVTLGATESDPEPSPTPSTGDPASPEPSPTETLGVEPGESAAGDPIEGAVSTPTPDESPSAMPTAS
jgi:hypothetical protein